MAESSSRSKRSKPSTATRCSCTTARSTRRGSSSSTAGRDGIYKALAAAAAQEIQPEPRRRRARDPHADGQPHRRRPHHRRARSDAELRELDDSGKPLPFDILTLWHNSFDDLIAKVGRQRRREMLSARVDARQARPPTAPRSSPASKQGRQLRLDADALAINMNSGFDDLIQFEQGRTGAEHRRRSAVHRARPAHRRNSTRCKRSGTRNCQAILEKEKTGGSKPKPRPPSSSTTRFTTSRASSCSRSSDRQDDAAHRRRARRLHPRQPARSQAAEEREDHRRHSEGAAPRQPPQHRRWTSSRRSRRRHYVFSANGRDGNPDPPTFTDLFKARPKGTYDIWLDERRRARGHADQRHEARGRDAASAERARCLPPHRAGRGENRLVRRPGAGAAQPAWRRAGATRGMVIRNVLPDGPDASSVSRPPFASTAPLQSTGRVRHRGRRRPRRRGRSGRRSVRRASAGTPGPLSITSKIGGRQPSRRCGCARRRRAART